MSSLHTLQNTPGSRIDSFRKGRGRGTGNGKTAGKGMKGQGAHAHTKANGFEGGQTPIARRLPKFGVRKTHKGRKTVYATVNLERLNRFEDGTVVNAALLIEKGVIKFECDGVKILGKGTLERKLVVEAKAFSASAKAAIEALGGEAKVL
ncbi:MAG: 50S ribosomal protein L15 [Bacilli bacterium]|nr:50S ribosomal protein L15 [Bacilli bacterium]